MKPILFNTEMVQAILDGRKTVTRRIIKNIPEGMHRIERDHGKWIACFGAYDNGIFYDYEKPIRPQPYKTGDILYVRETWHKYSKRVGKGEACRLETFYGYKASVKNSEDAAEKWKPSIHMPKEAARIFLRVVSVRAERLQDMPHDGAEREGIYYYENCGFTWERSPHFFLKTPMSSMEFLWDLTYKKMNYAWRWEANPWVWVIEFERCEKPVEYSPW